MSTTPPHSRPTPTPPSGAAPPRAVVAPRLAVAGLACRRGGRPLFSGFDLSVERGQVVWLRGCNGRGKTSLLRTLAGLSSPARGEIRVDGVLSARSDAAVRGGIAYVAHANALKDDLTAGESLRFAAALHGRRPTAGELDVALAQTGVARLRDVAVRSLSQGQRRRVALARLALPLAPALWLLDEPCDALDDAGVQALHALLTAHARRGGAALLTSHQPLTLRDPVPLTIDLDAHADAVA